MSFYDIEKQIGSPMQIPIDLNSGNEYYYCADDEMSEIDDNDTSDNSIEYCEPDDDEQLTLQLEQEYRQKQIEIKQHQHQQQQYQQQQQQEQLYKKFIESLQFMSLNEQQIMLYQGHSNDCIIQMES